ncbi:SGNH/GDSL hydrolase family protein [Gordonia sp. NPDC003424]
MRRWIVALALCVSALTGCSTDQPAQQKTLVNLGDSYSAGAGIYPQVEDSTAQCLRSSRNFAHLLAAAKGFHLDDVSCSSADTADFFSSQYFGVPPQLDAVAADDSVVTMMIGGNDSGVFSGAIGACSSAAPSDPQGAPCRAAHGSQFTDIVETSTYPALVKAFNAVRAKAPSATVIAVGYPWIVPRDTGCYPAVPVATGDVPYLRDLQRILNDAVARAAAQTGVHYVDMSTVSDGHDACQPGGQRWIEPPTGASGASPWHPNEAGQQAIADQIAGQLR